MLAAAEPSGLTELGVGVSELVVDGVAMDDGPVPGVGDASVVAAASVAPGVGAVFAATAGVVPGVGDVFATAVGDVPGVDVGLAEAAGVVPGAGEGIGVARGKSFSNSRRSSLWVLPLCA